jgi:hypothetical protein
LKTTSPELWRKHVEHILGEEVTAYRTLVNGAEFSASWETVLSYEFQIRKLATKKVLYEDMDIASALQASRLDLQTKERWFITPTAIGAASSSRVISNSNRYEDRSKPYEQKGKGGKKGGKDSKGGKGKTFESKGSSKGSGSNNRRQQFKALKTPDGRLICEGYQSGSCKYNDKCRYVHVCARCYGDHPSSGCTKN